MIKRKFESNNNTITKNDKKDEELNYYKKLSQDLQRVNIIINYNIANRRYKANAVCIN